MAGVGLAAPSGTRIVPPRTLTIVAEVRDVHVEGGRVLGRLVNLTDHPLEHVKLMVTDDFLWKNEFHPGRDNPGRVVERVLDVAVPPNGSVAFSFPHETLPHRTDGRFVTTARVIGLTEQPVRTGYSAAPPRRS